MMQRIPWRTVSGFHLNLLRDYAGFNKFAPPMRSLVLIILLIFPLSVASQYAWDYGLMMGAANYLGELGGDEKTRRDFVMDMKLGQTRWATGSFVRYKFNNLINLKASLTYGRIQGSDKLSSNRGRRGRNLSFRNDLVELSNTMEVNFYQVNDVGRTGRYRVDFRTYAFTGLGCLYQSPKAEYQGKWHALKPLQTEGVKYSNFNLSIPSGAGFYYTFKRKYRIGWEIGYRVTFTDYLDDISTNYASKEQLGNDPLRIALANRRNELGNSTDVPAKEHYGPPSNVTNGKRGDPTHNDGYFFTTINFSYVPRGKGNFYRSKYNFIFGNKRKYRRKFILRRVIF